VLGYITSFVMKVDPDDLSVSISQFELNSRYDLFRLADCHCVAESFNDAFHGFYPDVLDLINFYFGKPVKKKKRNDDNEKDVNDESMHSECSIIATKSGRVRFIARVHSLINWLQCCYDTLVPDGMAAIYRSWMKNINTTDSMNKVSHFYLVENLMYPLFTVVGSGVRSEFFDIGGNIPFFTGCRYRVNQHLAIAVKNRMEENENDTYESKIVKDHLRRCYMVLLNERFENFLARHSPSPKSLAAIRQ
jgi:hypothetical protein